MNQFVSKVAMLLIGLLLPFISISQTAEADAFRQQLIKAQETYEVPGMAVAVIQDGKVVIEEGFGLLSTDGTAKVKATSNFGIASLSKAFTAVAVAMLVDEGKVDWDDPVRKHLPWFALHDACASDIITVEDLLCHRSGLGTFDGDLLWYGTDYSRVEILKRIRNYPLHKEFRTDYGYQNIMFLAAAEIVTVVSGMSWDEFVQQRIFDPLEMDQSNTSITQYKDLSNIAMPHVQGAVDNLRNYDNSGGAAAINSNVNDLSHWLQFWLSDGIYNGDTLLQAGTFRKLLQLHTTLTPSGLDRKLGTSFKGYGLGWFLMNYGDAKVAQHGGGLPGYISKIAIAPDEDFGVVILTNSETYLPTNMMYAALDAFLSKDSGLDWLTLYHDAFVGSKEQAKSDKAERAASRQKKTKPNLALKDYSGLYEDEKYGPAKVEWRDEQLHLTLIPTAKTFTSEMEHWHHNTFRIKFKDRFLPDGFVTFHFDSWGEITDFTIDLPNPDFHFYKLKFYPQESAQK